jgi:hypothetical protein
MATVPSGILIGLIPAAFGALVGVGGARVSDHLYRRAERREAVAALLFELNSNLKFAERVDESRNYLRDEAWVTLKNKGYVSYLAFPLPSLIAIVYDRLHALNQCTHDVRDIIARGADPEPEITKLVLDRREEFRDRAQELIAELSRKAAYRSFVRANGFESSQLD